MPCRIGGKHCRLRHIGWELSGRGLTSRPRETADPRFLSSLPVVFGYPRNCGADLIRGSVPLRYCTVSFAAQNPNWDLSSKSKVLELVTGANSEPGGACEDLVMSGRELHGRVSCDMFGVVCYENSLGRSKRIRLT